MVGWALIMEYALGASAVAVGWSGYVAGLLHSIGVVIPPALAAGPDGGGLFNMPAVVIVALVTGLLVVGTKESASVNAVLVAIKVAALTAFVALTLPLMHLKNFTPFTPQGWGNPLGSGGTGVLGAAASIFFAYVGFDAVSTAAEETKNPQRNVPIGLLASLVICTLFYLLVAGGAIGAYGAQPVYGAHGEVLAAGSRAATAGLLAGSLGPCAASGRPSRRRQCAGSGGRVRTAFGRAFDDVRPDASVLRDGAGRAFTQGA
jgi:APA family basic amino acid/polyamine antiporter